MIQQPQTQVVVVQATDFNERHRCQCCCCRCCHIKTACIVLMVFELLYVVWNLYIAYVALTVFPYPGMKAIQSLSIINCISLVVTMILCFVAIGSVKPKLVLPHVGALVLSMVINAICGIIIIAAAASSDTTWFFGKTISYGGLTFKVRSQTTLATADVFRFIIGTIIGVALGAWFIYLLLKLKKYLEEVQAGPQANYQMAPQVEVGMPVGSVQPGYSQPPAYASKA